MLSLLVAPSSAADEKPLLDRPPFDRVTLNEANDNAMLEVLPLDLPQRPLVNLPTEGKLTLQLVTRPTESFDVDWTAIAQVRTHDQILLEEAQRLTAAGDFDAAYDYFTRLSLDYPQLGGLNDAVSDFLRRNAFALYKATENDRAMALLLTLYERNPRDPGLPKAVETVAGEIIKEYLRQQEFAAARAVLNLWRIQFRGIAPDAAVAWQRRFEAAAERKLVEARQLLAQKQFIPARKAAEGALGIWPDLQPAAELLTQIQRDFPFVTVAVFETAPTRPTRWFDDWAALRTSPLVERTLAEQVGFGSEGGVYESPFGTWETDDSGLVLSLKVAPQAGVTADELARYLLRLVAPGHQQFHPNLANLLDGVSIADANTLQLHLVRPHVRPEALLQFAPPGGAVTPIAVSAAAHPPGFLIADHGPDQVVFTPAAEGGTDSDAGLQAIIERRMPDDQAAVDALLAGDVDVLDRVPPWRVDQLRAASGIRLETYRLPTVHVLIPNLQRPLLAKREFRRALCFGIDRKWIVERVLLGGVRQAGYEVVSGPFPTGLSLSDPIRYAYDSQLAPRPFEPRLAAILAEVAWTNVQAAAHKTAAQNEANANAGDDGDPPREVQPDDVPLTDIPELVLAHPSDPLARIACQSIELQLEREGIPIKLREATADELLSGKLEYDLRYAELAVWEPVADAQLIMGQGGLAAINSPYLNAALRRLESANNWKDVRTQLTDIHQIAHHELPVIPLWQTANYYAYRQSLDGIGDTPVTLYQHVDHWQLSSRASVAQAAPAP